MATQAKALTDPAPVPIMTVSVAEPLADIGEPLIGASQTVPGPTEALIQDYLGPRLVEQTITLAAQDALPGRYRAFDVALAALFLLLLLPVIALAALLVILSGPGPVLFRHTRIGLNGRTFQCLKFRTMQQNAEHLLPHIIDGSEALRREWEQDQKVRSDPRITRIGRVLRMFSIDELPQLVNVLTGDMSIVGPRPIVAAEVSRYGDAFADYCSVKPGLTGLWQTSGRNDVSYAQRVRLDSEYARTKSIVGDLHIIARTVPVVLRGSGY